ncbi:MAG: LmeA family phospholipid-binding protein [Acidimicrobiia bacterium]|nr:LmeA family phospholipid-binding protein [Acidimicrobiia bacterium]
MRRLVVALAVIVVILVVGDFVAKAYAATQLRDRALQAVRGATSSSASISSFPFVGRLLVAGSVPGVQVRVGPVTAGRVTFASVDVDLRDVRIDRNRLINDREVRLTALGSGTVTAELTDTEVSRLIGVPVSFSPGRVSVRAEGVDLGATVNVTNGTMSFGGIPLPIRLRVPRASLFPCDATSAVVVQGAVDLSCSVHNVPTELIGRSVKAA